MASESEDIKKYGNQKKDRMKTKPYGIEDRKVKTEKLLSRKELEKLRKEKGIGLLASPSKKEKGTIGLLASPSKELKSGGRVNLRGGGICLKGINKKAYGKNS